MAEIWKDSVSGRRIAEAVKPICVLDDGGKVMKKPDKLLACPRCSSLDSKFCYFNNCNVSQPRHFCKRCQRYWTSGGTMQNVPVGSGRRKGKHSSAFSHPRFRNRARSNSLEESTLQFPQQDTARHLQMGCSVQEFCSVSPTSPSDAIPVLSYGKEAETGSASDEQEVTSEKEKLASSSSSVGTQIISSEQLAAMEQSFAAAELFMRGYPLSFPMGLWPYGYGPFPAPVSPMIPHAFAIPPWPLMPTPPWGRPAENAPPFREGGAGEGFPLTPLTPKTLRIHHPAEAAQSSIWSALGIDYKSDFPKSVGAIFDGFPLKAVVAGTEEPPTVDAICSNPAAMTRSAAYHENS